MRLTNSETDSVNQCESRVYQNAGNPGLLAMLDPDSTRIMDVGCGAGDNARLIKAYKSGVYLFGITRSPAEARIAERYMEKCWIADIECDFPADIQAMQFDTLVFSHVLEHLRNPEEVLARYLALLQEGGTVLIAVPNILAWSYRLKFLLGRFEYESSGALDETHLRFFTFDSSDRFLLRHSKDLQVVSKTAEGSVPLWILRRYMFPKRLSGMIDRLGCRFFPNLFGGQILIKGVKRKTSNG